MISSRASCSLIHMRDINFPFVEVNVMFGLALTRIYGFWQDFNMLCC